MATNTTSLRIRFDASEFRRAHGKAPRGRATWAFSLRRQPDPLTDEIQFSSTMPISEARKWIVARLGAMGIEGEHVVYILP